MGVVVEDNDDFEKFPDSPIVIKPGDPITNRFGLDGLDVTIEGVDADHSPTTEWIRELERESFRRLLGEPICAALDRFNRERAIKNMDANEQELWLRRAADRPKGE